MRASYHFHGPGVACSLEGPSRIAVPSPVVLHLSRPYANAEEYLSREAWSIDTRSMLLVGQAELPPDTEIAFDVTLGDGSKPIRAEAKVIGVVVGVDGRRGGLRIRFKRAVAARWSAGDAPGATPDPPSAQSARGSVRPAPASVPPPESIRPPVSVRPASVPPTGSVPPSGRPSPMPGPGARPSSMPVWEEDKTSRFSRAIALAAPMTHQPSEAGAPANRDVLLERLRKRAKESEGSGG
jgi:hypothetical protein